jgi:hypothetical protein
LIRLIFEADHPSCCWRVTTAKWNRDGVARGKIFKFGRNRVREPRASDIDGAIDRDAGPAGDRFGK